MKADVLWPLWVAAFGGSITLGGRLSVTAFDEMLVATGRVRTEADPRIFSDHRTRLRKMMENFGIRHTEVKVAYVAEEGTKATIVVEYPSDDTLAKRKVGRAKSYYSVRSVRNAPGLNRDPDELVHKSLAYHLEEAVQINSQKDLRIENLELTIARLEKENSALWQQSQNQKAIADRTPEVNRLQQQVLELRKMLRSVSDITTSALTPDLQIVVNNDPKDATG